AFRFELSITRHPRLKIIRPMKKLLVDWQNPTWWNLLVVLPWAIGTILFVREWITDKHMASREQITHGVVKSQRIRLHCKWPDFYRLGEPLKRRPRNWKTGGCLLRPTRPQQKLAYWF